jgi:hypothetical protein
MKQEYIDYLKLAVSEGYLDFESAMLIILKKDAKIVKKMMEEGNNYLNK